MNNRIFLSSLAALLLAAPARAVDGGPVRCEAVWRGPATGCQLGSDWAGTGFGRDETRASRAAIERIQLAVAAGADAAALRALGPSATAPVGSQADSCREAVATYARLTCFAEPTLKEDRLCFLDLPVPACWSGGPITAEGVAWRTSERGRDQICAEMRSRLTARGASALELASCEASCQQEARVRCPDGG